MRFFDLVAMDNGALDKLACRLGYRKIFYMDKEAEIVDGIKESGRGKGIVRSNNNEVIIKMLRKNWVVGILPANDSVSKHTLEAIKDNEKVLFLPMAEVACAEEEKRQQKLNKVRTLVRNALRAKVGFVLVSLADKKEGLLSSTQMLEVANFLGIEQKAAKAALGRLGDLL